MQKFSSFGRKKKNRPKFDIEWLCSKVFICTNESPYTGHLRLEMHSNASSDSGVRKTQNHAGGKTQSAQSLCWLLESNQCLC